jgi:hypothetical protein
VNDLPHGTIPIGSLTAFVRPPGTLFMIPLKAYFDNSDADTVVAFAGYVSTVDKWAEFEVGWDAVLREFGVPYLHMKEFAKEGGVYEELKNDPVRKAAFFSGLIDIISEHTVACISASIRIRDLERFNFDRGLNLNPHSVALYGCIMQLLGEFPQQAIQVVVDKVEKPYGKIDQAVQHAMMDGAHDSCERLLEITPLRSDESFKSVLGMQAADFVAWELRKSNKDRDEFFEHYYPGSNNWPANMSAMINWMSDYFKRYGEFPRERKSFQRLI